MRVRRSSRLSLDKHKDSSSTVSTVLNQLFTIRDCLGDGECFVYLVQKTCSKWRVIYSRERQQRDCKHVFLFPPNRRINKKTAVRRFNSEMPLTLQGPV